MNQENTVIRDGSNIISYIKRPVKHRAELWKTVSFLEEKLPEIVIFGGMIRDFELDNARGFCSDIDLVTLSSRKELYQAIKKYNPIRNKFGGFRFSSGKWMYDVWSLADTWAIKEGLCADDSFDGLLSTTFFNLDSAYLHLSKNKIIVSKAFDFGIKEKVLDINLRYNPAPQKMVKRAISLAYKYNLPLSLNLVKYIVQQKSVMQALSNNRLYERMLFSLEADNKIFYLEEQLELRI